MMRAQQLRQLVFLILLTLVYLCFELGFNARLLDVVGGNAGPHDVERLEVFGRTLSGVAAALVLLQVLLRRRLHSPSKRPSLLRIAVGCLLVAGAVFVTIKVFVDVLVATRDAEFRRVAYNTILLQRSLVNGQAELDGLVDDKLLFAQPEGKAFLALFPFLALSNQRLDERMKGTKDQVIGNIVRSSKTGQQYYEDYLDAIKRTHTSWQKYARIPSASNDDLQREQDKAWNDYVDSLRKHNWTPYTVPGYRRAAVVKKVRQKVPVSARWDPSDEVAFRDAVEQRYRKSTSGITVGRDRIPPGLSFAQFVARPGVQAQLREALALPPGAVVAHDYGSAAEFKRLYEAMVGKAVRDRRASYDSDAAQFEYGARLFKDGNEAARAAIVPPVALAFSLLGAIGHFSKLLYLIATLVLLLRAPGQDTLSRRAGWTAMTVLLAVFIGVWSVLSLIDNRVTRSPLFTQMLEQSRAAEEGDTGWTRARKAVVANVTHVVAVGQGYSYPLNEAIRVNLLQDLNYGYEPTP